MKTRVYEYIVTCLLLLTAYANANTGSGFYYKQRLGLMLQIDGYGLTQRVQLLDRPWCSSYGIWDMMVKEIHVIRLPMGTNRNSIKCWVLCGPWGNLDGVMVLTADRHGNLKSLYSGASDMIDATKWRKGVFIVKWVNRNGHILSYQQIQWNPDVGRFTKGQINEATSELNRWSLNKIFGSVRIFFSLKNGRWAKKSDDYLVRFTPSGYIKNRLPGSLRDVPCVQAKLKNGWNNMVDNDISKLLLSRCSPINDDGLAWQGQEIE